jgi:hypothetical protein
MKLSLKPLIINVGLFLLAGIVSVSYGQAPEQDENLVKIREVIQTFETELKQELKQALETGGTESAIKICAEKAPIIASSISRKQGWTIHRVSLKQRNPLNRPDEYELAVLKGFARQADEGHPSESMEQYETVITHGIREARYMKAIIIKPLCLMCHGPKDDISPAALAEIKNNYPHDMATGYSTGQLRGAFSVRIPIE